MKFAFISIDRPERKANIVEQSAKLSSDSDILVYDCIDAHTMQLRHLQHSYTPGMIGCFLSHRALIQHLCLMNISDPVCIFEDDVLLLDNFAELYSEAISVAPSNADIIAVGWYSNHGKFAECKNNELYQTLISGNVWGMHAYVIPNANAAARVLAKLRNMNNQVDVQLFYEAKFTRLNVYFLKKILARQIGFQTTVQR